MSHILNKVLGKKAKGGAIAPPSVQHDETYTYKKGGASFEVSTKDGKIVSFSLTVGEGYSHERMRVYNPPHLKDLYDLMKHYYEGTTPNEPK